jgi:hypothetical protein
MELLNAKFHIALSLLSVYVLSIFVIGKKVKVKLSLCVFKNYTRKTDGEVEV